MERGTFVLHLSQPSVSPATMARKRRKLETGKPPPVKSSAHGGDPAGNNSSQLPGPPPPAGPMDPANKACAPAAEEVPLVLVAEPQAPTWARHIVRILETGEFPGDQDEADIVSRRASMYQFVDVTLYRRRPNGVN